MTRPRLFERQLRRTGVSNDVAPSLEQWQSYLECVDRTYTVAEQDRYTSERSLSISSEEMRELYDDLKRSSESLLAVERDKLKKSVAVHEAILEAALDGVLVVDEQRAVVAYSTRFVELWGLSDDEIAAMNEGRRKVAFGTRFQDPDAFTARIEDIYSRPHEASQDELHLVDGRTIDRISAPVRSDMSETYGRVWFFRDITARRRQQEQIREANRFLDSIVEGIPHMVFVKDATTLRFVRFNRAGEELLGRPRETLLGKSDFELFTKGQAELFVAKDREVLGQRTVMTLEEPIETPIGTRWLSTKKIPILDDKGAPRYLLGISEDITEQLRKRAELVTAKETAEEATHAKSDFLRNMSHEMRTPLNAILGFARVLERETRATVTDDHREFLQHMVQAGEHMLGLINDLLDLRRLEETRPQVAPIDLAPIIDETIGLVRSLIDEKALALTIDISPNLPLIVAERRAVVQILINLISNAAKFTPAGGSVAVHARVASSHVHVSVQDSGIGIAPEDQEKLFKYFEQVGAKHAHQMKGSGVGLALTRALVERQGGAITVRSAVGVGSTFAFHLPAAP